MENKTVAAIGCDHGGFAYKEKIITVLKDHGFEVVDHGTNSVDSTDYPDHIHPVGNDIDCGKASIGIILCGSGNGAAMTANKHQKVRAALCWTDELASLARLHNNANVLAIPARFVDEKTAISMVNTFLETEFEGGRHSRRVDKIPSKDLQNC
jgi:ribose 5-phosphate isomerase B